MTEKQKLQRDRSWLKFQLSGIKFLIDYEHLTILERGKIAQIKNNISWFLANFESNSSQLGLNIPEHRCWCGKEGKYTPVGYPQPTNLIKVCKKHIEYA
jgi:hypothetical protein